ncbi:MAG TPA: hypothetical protein VK864_20795, partial [Longimicrobiales bacterium]|nr:hypothetical protein [Longimicrobiales bacterium]
MKSQLPFLICALTACSTNGEPVAIDPVGDWSVKSPLPTPRQEMPSALIANRIYTPGGYDAGRAASAVLE